MRNRTFLTLALLVFSWGISGFSYEERRLNRCQLLGDGGFPHFQIYSPSLENLVKTGNLVKDFLIWENASKMVYHSEVGDVRSYDLKNSSEQFIDYPIKTSLSQVTDPEERFLLEEHGGRMKDTWKSSGWKTIYPPGYRILQHAFWNQRKLYSVFQPHTFDRSFLGVFSYDANTSTGRSCYVGVKAGETLEIAEGHQYPYIYFYKQTPVNDGFHLETYRVNVSQPLNKICSLQKIQGYLDPIPGRVLKFSHYPAIGGNIMQIDHPKKKLLWDRGVKECFFYNTQDRNIYPLMSNMPVVATWKPGEGLGILNAQSSRATLLKGVGQLPIFGKNLWLTKNAQTLYVAQRVDPQAPDNRIVFEFEMQNLPIY